MTVCVEDGFGGVAGEGEGRYVLELYMTGAGRELTAVRTISFSVQESLVILNVVYRDFARGLTFSEFASSKSESNKVLYSVVVDGRIPDGIRMWRMSPRYFRPDDKAAVERMRMADRL